MMDEPSHGLTTSTKRSKDERKKDRDNKLLISAEDNKSKVVGFSNDKRWVKNKYIIGSGSFKVVYRGYDSETAKPVAWCEYKLPSNINNSSKSLSNQIESNEIGYMMRLSHPNIVEMMHYLKEWKEIEEGDEKPIFGLVIITELMSYSLRESLQKYHVSPSNDNLPYGLFGRWCREILEALDYMHKCNPPLIHRDLKADNIFVYERDGDRYTHVKIGDFGISSELTEQQQQTIVGTIGFMAPEIFAEKYDTAVDIYAFGMVMFEMLTNKLPNTNNVSLFSMMINSLLYIVPEEIKTNVRRDAAMIICACLHPLPAFRPAAKDLLWLPLFNPVEQFLQESLSESEAESSLKTKRPFLLPIAVELNLNNSNSPINCHHHKVNRSVKNTELDQSAAVNLKPINESASVISSNLDLKEDVSHDSSLVQENSFQSQISSTQPHSFSEFDNLSKPALAQNTEQSHTTNSLVAPQADIDLQLQNLVSKPLKNVPLHPKMILDECLQSFVDKLGVLLESTDSCAALDMRLHVRDPRLLKSLDLNEGETLEFEFDVYGGSKELDLVIEDMNKSYAKMLERVFAYPRFGTADTAKNQADRVFSSIASQLRFYQNLILGVRAYEIFLDLNPELRLGQVLGKSDLMSAYSSYSLKWSKSRETLDNEIHTYLNRHQSSSEGEKSESSLLQVEQMTAPIKNPIKSDESAEASFSQSNYFPAIGGNNFSNNSLITDKIMQSKSIFHSIGHSFESSEVLKIKEATRSIIREELHPILEKIELLSESVLKLKKDLQTQGLQSLNNDSSNLSESNWLPPINNQCEMILENVAFARLDTNFETYLNQHLGELFDDNYYVDLSWEEIPSCDESPTNVTDSMKKYISLNQSQSMVGSILGRANFSIEFPANESQTWALTPTKMISNSYTFSPLSSTSPILEANLQQGPTTPFANEPMRFILKVIFKIFPLQLTHDNYSEWHKNEFKRPTIIINSHITHWAKQKQYEESLYATVACLVEALRCLEASNVLLKQRFVFFPPILQIGRIITFTVPYSKYTGSTEELFDPTQSMQYFSKEDFNKKFNQMLDSPVTANQCFPCAYLVLNHPSLPENQRWSFQELFQKPSPEELISQHGLHCIQNAVGYPTRSSLNANNLPLNYKLIDQLGNIYSLNNQRDYIVRNLHNDKHFYNRLLVEDLQYSQMRSAPEFTHPHPKPPHYSFGAPRFQPNYFHPISAQLNENSLSQLNFPTSLTPIVESNRQMDQIPFLIDKNFRKYSIPEIKH